MKNSPYSSNKIGSVNYRYTVFACVIMLILSLILATANRLFYMLFAVVFLLICCLLYSYKRMLGFLFLGILIFIYCLRGINALNTIEKTEDIAGRRETISAVAIENGTVHGDNYGSCTVKITFSENGIIEKNTNLILYGSGAGDLNIGDSVHTVITVKSLRETKSKTSFYADNVFVGGYKEENIVSAERVGGIYGFAGRINEYVTKTLVYNTENNGILQALITGNMSYLDASFYEKVKVSGVSHVLVVSGMHLTILCSSIWGILNALSLKEWLKDLILLLFVFLLICICGFGISIMRAATVYVFMVIYRRLARHGDSMLFLSNAVITVLLIQPLAFHSLAFKLSFASTFGILQFTQGIKRLIVGKKEIGFITDVISDAASVSIAAYVATLPIVIAELGTASLYAILANILIAYPVNWMLILTVVGLLIAPVGLLGYTEKAVFYICDILCNYFINVVELIAKLPLAVIGFRNGKLLAFIIIIAALAVYLCKSNILKDIFKRGDSNGYRKRSTFKK